MIINIHKTSYEVASRDFIRSGDASKSIKKTLNQMGFASQLVRKVCIATYEAEMNIAIHSHGGEIILIVDDYTIAIQIIDRGPGIANIEQAMKAGYSTATNEMIEMGFGAGMGFYNMQKCANVFKLESKKNEGTKIDMIFYIECNED
ncbi:ATP-binding protein [Alkalibaculum sporogenes]